LELLVDNLSRLNEEEESDRQGVFHVLGRVKFLPQQILANWTTGIFENFVSLIPSLATTLVSKTSVMKWLLKRIQSEKHDENRSYAAELLSILLQTSFDNKTALAKHDGVETLLKVLSVRCLLPALVVLLT
jgi:beta-catenin-like protein 1